MAWDPTPLGWRVLRVLGLALAGTYALYAALLYTVQDSLIFPVPSTSRQQLDRWAADAGIQTHEPVAADGTRLYAWHLPRDGERLYLFFHGNGGGIGAAPWFAEQLPGWDVVSFSYRGYPGSQGTPSEAGLVLDARAIWTFATEDLGFRPDQIVVHGQSLGGGVANHLLAEVHPRAAVFDSTFASVTELAAGTAPLLPHSLLLKHPFRSRDRAPDIPIPVFLVHGDADTLIPATHGRALSQLYPNARYHEVPGGGHHQWLLDDPGARAAWLAFVAAHRP